MALVYSLDRVRRLRLLLRVDVCAGVLLCLLAGFAVNADRSFLELGLVTGGAGLALVATAVVGLRLLDGRDVRAKAVAVLAGVLTLLAGLPFASSLLGWALILIGMFILALALLRDDPSLET